MVVANRKPIKLNDTIVLFLSVLHEILFYIILLYYTNARGKKV